MPIPEFTPPPPFPEYDLDGIGTVTAHEGDTYICRTADGRVIGWPAQSGTPSEEDAAADFTAAQSDPAPRISGFIAAATTAVQAMLDARAQQAGYDGILSAASYAADPTGVFAAEGAAFSAWRSNVWAACYTALAAHNPADPLPTISAFLAGLPAYVSPS